MKGEFPLHDTMFDGLVLQGKNGKLYFTTTDGRGCEVALLGIDALQMDDFREGNVVVFFGTTTSEPPDDNIDLSRLYTPPHPNAPAEYQAQYSAFRDRKIAAIIAGELTLVEMEPSIGATLLATCEQVQLRVHGDGS